MPLAKSLTPSVMTTSCRTFAGLFRRRTSRKTELSGPERKLHMSLPLHQDGSGGARTSSGQQVSQRHRGAAVASLHRVSGHAFSFVHAGRPRTHRRSLSPVAERYLSLLGLHAI